MESRSGEIWGTWEDLVVAKLVARDGPRWGIVAVELRARVHPAAAPHFTPQSCQQRFNELHRRFAPDDPDIDDGVFPREIPWTDDLLLLRLDYLRRELENSGVPIGVLGLKADQMKEEREQKLREKSAGREREPKAASGGSGAGDPVSGENLQLKPAVEEPPDPAAAGDEKAASCGSTETLAKGDAEASLPADAGMGRRRELADSAAQSKEGEGDKENSDVQSSASLSKGRRRKRGSKVVSGVGDAGQLSQPRNGTSQPLITFLELIKSHDYGTELERVLLTQVIKFINEELGSMIVLPSMWRFRNRCIINGEIRINEAKISNPPSSETVQETVKSSSMIRRPVDMDMVRGKLAGGAYGSNEFYRDLLLLCTNTIVIFPKGSRESMAAIRLRNLILSETCSIMKKPPPVSQVLTLALAARTKPPPPDKESTQPLVPKMKLELEVKRPSQLTACKKRSSISVKPAAPLLVVLATESKVEKDENLRTDGDRKDSDGDDEFLNKKLSGTRRVRTTKNRGRSSVAALKSPIIAPQLLAMPPAPALKLSPASGENRPTPLAKPQKKSSGATSGAGSSLAKKRGAATFLNRIKEKSPPPSSPPPLSSTNLLEALKGASSSGYAGKGPEMKKELAPRSRPSGKAAAEKAATVKRSVGRPPKRTAPPLTPPPAKRLKEDATVAPPLVKRVKDEVSATAAPPPMKRVKEGEGGSSSKATATAAAAAPPPTKRVKDGEGGSGSGPTSKITAAAAAPPPVKRACPPPVKRVKEEASASTAAAPPPVKRVCPPPQKRVKEEASASTATAPPPVKRVCPPPQKRPREEVAATAATAPPPAKRVCPPPVKRVREEAAAAPPPVMKVKEETSVTVIPPPLKRVKEEPAGSSKRGEAMSASKKKGRK